MTKQVDRGHGKLLLIVTILSLCAYGSWRGAGWFEAHHEDPLSSALSLQDFQEARRLIKMGANVNELNGAPLIFAFVQHENIEFAQYLLDKGADINARQPGELSALEHSAARGKKDGVEWLMERGGEYTLVAATLLNDVETVKQALEKDPGLLDRMNSEGYPLLHMAVRGGHKDMAEYLLECGADPDEELWSPFAGNNFSARLWAQLWKMKEMEDFFSKWDTKAAAENAPKSDEPAE